jgi:ABC-type polysaccharide/polyol phosphate export permease
MACCAFGVGLVVGLANIRFRDVSYLVGIAMQALFYGTPIVYPLSLVPDEYQGILKANPITSFVDATREAVYLLEVPSTGNWLVMGAMAAVCLVGGWVIFSRWAPTVIEEL